MAQIELKYVVTPAEPAGGGRALLKTVRKVSGGLMISILRDGDPSRPLLVIVADEVEACKLLEAIQNP